MQWGEIFSNGAFSCITNQFYEIFPNKHSIVVLSSNGQYENKSSTFDRILPHCVFLIKCSRLFVVIYRGPFNNYVDKKRGVGVSIKSTWLGGHVTSGR